MRTALFILLALTLFQCKKDEEFQLEGTITDKSFNSTLEGAKVELYVLQVGVINKYDLLETMTTGSDGKYSFKFKRNKVERYKLIITKDNYFQLTKEFANDDLSLKDVNTYSFDITAKAWVKLSFNNVDFQQPLTFTKQKGKVDCEECCPGTEQTLPNNGNSDTIIYCINDGNFDYSIFYKVGGSTVSDIKSVNTTAFDTTEIKIIY